ncbi:gas vesicle protein K [Streptomyces sp. NPDC058659]|uniref:gas vesicle protein K n=1 Tax=unclassified Streptomyces TaxID=2593676 RepID=UPI00364D8A04
MNAVSPGSGERRSSPEFSRALGEAGASLGDAFRLLQAPPTPADEPRHPARRIRTDRESVEEDLLKLVLTLVELLRQLIERQALRRVDAGDLTDEQEEELGATLMALHDALADLCAEHGFTLADLNLDLGPLGPLLPPVD